MRTRVVAQRLIRQLMRDRRTLAMLFVAPVVILLLMNAVFSASDVTIRFDAVDVPKNYLQTLARQSATTVQQVTTAAGQQALSEDTVDALLQWEASAQTLTLTVEGSQPAITAQTLKRIQATQAEFRQLAPKLVVKYLHGGANLTTLDYFAPVLIGFFIFLFVFILSGVSFLRERTTGTLERALVTPLTRRQLVIGYLLGFGGFAFVQTLVIQFIAIYGLQVTHVGSLWLVTLFNLLLAVVALSLGMLLSAYARTELQMLQFIPLVIVPQVFLSGMFDLRGMPHWLVVLSQFLPLTYAAQALRAVMIRGAGFVTVWYDAGLLLAYALVLMLLTVLALRKYQN